VLRDLLSDLRYRLIALLRRSRLERELDDELRFHIERQTALNVTAGMSPTDARTTALREFGGIERRKEEVRETRGVSLIEHFVQDLSYALRGLRAKPGFTFAVVLTLGLGVGANAAMFSVVDRLLFRPPPGLRDPALTHRVYYGSTHGGKESLSNAVAYARYADLMRWTSSFTRFAQAGTAALAIGTGADAREMPVGVVSASLFAFFDAPAAIGRYFTNAEDSPPSGTPVVVLSHAFWQTQFGGRSDALGSTLRIGTLVYTIIGVAPAGFVGLSPSRPPVAYIPISSYFGGPNFPWVRAGDTWWGTYYYAYSSNTFAQRKPGVTVETANADLSSAMVRSYQAERAANPSAAALALVKPHGIVASVLAERGPNQSNNSKVATWVSGVALIVLLIACANVANLLLARALSRRREIAVRLALGVSRRRLLSQLVTESVLLAALGGVAGLVIAQAGGALLRAAFLPTWTAAGVASDPRTLAFAAAAALAAGLFAGVAPAWQLRGIDLTSDLRVGARDGRHHRSPLRLALQITQGALSVLLLVGAGLFVRSLGNVRAVRLGYDVDPVLVLKLHMRGVTLDRAHKVQLRERLLAAAKTLPEVENASRQTTMPFLMTVRIALYVPGIDSAEKLGQFNLNEVSPEYFATLGTRIVRGRGINAGDHEGAPGAMVVSASMARRLWPSSDAIGQCVKLGADTLPCTSVVGIAEDIKAQKLEGDPGYNYYLPIAQSQPGEGGLFIRTRGPAARFADGIRRRLQPQMPGASYLTVTPLDEVIGEQTRTWELGARMFLTFGLLALLLAAMGLFSVISYNVAQRTRELGVRAALGARTNDLITLVVREGVKLGVIGIAIGAAIALAGGRWIAPLLFNESPRDPAVFGLVALVLLGVTIAASWVPARRAARVDPQVALRTE
jgi:predicted permease